MKLKKRTDASLKKDSIYNQPWSYWLKQGVPDTTEYRDFFAQNRGRKGDWILDLLVASMIDDTPNTTPNTKNTKEQLRYIKEQQQDDDISNLRYLLPDIYDGLDETLTKEQVLETMKQKLKKQDNLYADVMERQKDTNG